MPTESLAPSGVSRQTTGTPRSFLFRTRLGEVRAPGTQSLWTPAPASREQGAGWEPEPHVGATWNPSAQPLAGSFPRLSPHAPVQARGYLQPPLPSGAARPPPHPPAARPPGPGSGSVSPSSRQPCSVVPESCTLHIPAAPAAPSCDSTLAPPFLPSGPGTTTPSKLGGGAQPLFAAGSAGRASGGGPGLAAPDGPARGWRSAG